MSESSSPNLPGEPIENCPQCGYSRQGLAVESTCPECALCLDASSRKFRLGSLFGFYLQAALGVFILLMVLLGVLMEGFQLFADKPYGTIIMTACGLFLIGFGLRCLILHRRTGQTAFITTNGVFIAHDMTKRLFRWSQISRIQLELSRSNGPVRLVFHLKGSRRIWPRVTLASTHPGFADYADSVVRQWQEHCSEPS